MSGRGTKPTPRPKKASKDTFYGNVQESQTNNGGEIVAFREIIYLDGADDKAPSQGSTHDHGKTRHSNAADTHHPKDELVNKEFSHGEGGATRTFYQPINGFVRHARNHGKVTATSKTVVYKVNDGTQLCHTLESGTLESNGIVQGLLGHGSVKVEEKRTVTVAGGSREYSQINTTKT